MGSATDPRRTSSPTAVLLAVLLAVGAMVVPARPADAAAGGVTGTPTAMVSSPDGSRLYVASTQWHLFGSDHYLTVVDTATGDVLARTTGLDSLGVLAVSADGSTVSGASPERLTQYWFDASGALLEMDDLGLFVNPPTGLALSRDGSTSWFSTANGVYAHPRGQGDTLLPLDVGDPTLNGPTDPSQLAIGSDDRLYLADGPRQQIVVIDPTVPEVLTSVALTGPPSAVALSPDERWLATVNTDGSSSLVTWDGATLTGNEIAAPAVGASPTGLTLTDDTVLTVTTAGTALAGYPTADPERPFTPGTLATPAAALTAPATGAWVAGTDGSLTQLTAPQLTRPAPQSAPAGQSATLTTTAGGPLVPVLQWQSSADTGTTWIDVPGAGSPTLTVPDARPATPDVLYRARATTLLGTTTTLPAILTVTPGPNPPQPPDWISGAVPGAVSAMVSSPDGSRLYVASTESHLFGDDHVLTVLDPATGMQLAQNGLDVPLQDLAVSADGSTVTGFSWQLAGLYWFDAAGNLTGRDGVDPADVDLTGLVVSGDGSTAWFCTAGGVSVVRRGQGVTLLPLALGDPTLSGPHLGQLAVGPDDRLYLADGPGRRIVVIDPAVPQVLTTVALSGPPAGIDLSPDGRWLATANADGTSSLVSWNSITGTEIATPTVGSDTTALTVTDDAVLLLTAGGAALTSYPTAGPDNPVTSGVLATTAAAVTTTATGPWVAGTDGTLAQLTAPQLTDPQPQTVPAGQDATFTTTPTGPLVPTLQWQSSPDDGATWTDIPGATAPTVTVPDARPSDPDVRYRARATNPVGSTTTAAASLSAQAASVLSLSSPTPTPTFGQAVDVVATLPSGATGSVGFSAQAVSGPSTGQDIPLGTTTPDSQGLASVTASLPALGRYLLTASYSGDSTHAPASAPALTLDVGVDPGSLVVAEFRQSGPGGAADDYVVLTNTTTVPMPLAGFRFAAGNHGPQLQFRADDGDVPPGGSFLVTGVGFSLGAPTDAPSDGIGSRGIQVIAPDPHGTVTDAVGPVDGPHTGTPLPGLQGAPADQYAWVRTREWDGELHDTDDNATDFALVSTTGGLVGGVQSMLGSPHPTGTGTSTTTGVGSGLLDPAVPAGAAPNRIVTRAPGSPTTLQVTRWLTNETGSTVSDLRLRIITLSQAHGVARAGVARPASLRVVAPTNATGPLTATDGTSVVPVDLVPDAPSTVAGGGLNSTLTVPVPAGGLAPGESVPVALTFAADTGGTFWFSYAVETG